MGTVNVKFPDGMEEEVDAFIEETGLFINRSELVRDAVRRRIEDQAPLSAETLERIEQSKRDMEQGNTHSIAAVREQLGLADDGSS